MVSCAVAVMTAFPCASSWVASSNAVTFVKIDWLICIVSAAGLKFAIVFWPKFGANTNESCPTVTEWSDVPLPARMVVSLAAPPGAGSEADVGKS